MVRFKIKAEAGLLKAIASVVSITVDECRVDFKKEGIQIQAVDPAHISMIDFQINKGAFEEYICQEEGEFGIDLDIIKDILKKQRDNEIINMQFTNDDRWMTVRHGNFIRKVHQIDTCGMTRPSIPKMNLPGKFVIKYQDIKEIMRQLNGLSDHITFHFEKEGITISAKNDLETCKVKMSKELLEEHSYPKEGTGDYVSAFPEDYISNFIGKGTAGAHKLFSGKRPMIETIEINMGEDYPIVMSAEGNHMSIKYLTAPRINSE